MRQKLVVLAILTITAFAAGTVTTGPDAGTASHAPPFPRARTPQPALAPTAPRFVREGIGRSFRDTSGERYEGKLVTQVGDLVTIKTVYRNCRDTENGYSCDTEDIIAHPYAAYSFNELKSIAAFDATASFIMGIRIFEDIEYRRRFDGDDWYEAGVNHLLTASLLSGARQPYTAMMIQRDLHVLGYVNGAPGWIHLEEIYTWSKAGIDLGYLESDWPAFHAVKRYVNREMAENAAGVFEGLDEKAEAIKTVLIDSKARTTG